MAFRIRDLMVDVMPQGGIEGGIDCGGSRFTVIGTTNVLPCRTHTFTCPLPSGMLPQCHFPDLSIVVPPNVREYYYPRDLAALKEQLRTALAEVEAQEKAAEEASRPRTREEAEELEEKLKGALEEVRGWKETLPGGGSK
jgi:hypothetical protein